MSFNELTQVLPRMTMLSNNRQLDGWNAVGNIEAIFEQHSNLVIQNWYLYYGLHNLFLKRFEGESAADFAQRVADSTVENHIQTVVNTIASYLYPEKNKITRFVKRDDEIDKALMKLLKERVWNHNSFYRVDFGKALNALVSGYTIVQRQFYDIRTGKEFVSPTPTSEKSEYGYIHKSIVDSSKAMPFPLVDEDGTVHDDKLGAIVFYTKSDNFVGMPTLMSLLARQRMQTEKLEYVDDKVWLRWVRPLHHGPWQQVTVNPGSGFENKNPFGSIEIPFTLYRNTGDPFVLIGNSEIDKMRSLNLAINNLGSGDDAVIQYHSYPILLALEGAKLPTNFVRTKNAALESEEGSYSYLTWDNKLEASEKRQESLRRTISQTTGLSLISRGFLKDIGQIRSGPPLKALFTSDRNLMSTKFSAFADGEIRDMRSDVLFYDKVVGTKQNLTIAVEFDIEFERDFLGIDALLDAEINQLKASYGEDVEEILREEHPDWDEEKIKEQVKKYEDAKKAQAAQPKPGQRMKSSDKKASEQKGKDV